MILTRENLAQMTECVKHRSKPEYWEGITDTDIMRRLDHKNGIMFIEISRTVTVSGIPESIVLDVGGNLLDDAISVFNASVNGYANPLLILKEGETNER